MLQDDGRIGNEGPKVVRLEAWVALQIFEKCGLISVVVRVYFNFLILLVFVTEQKGVDGSYMIVSPT